jgi:hypothetical protein
MSYQFTHIETYARVASTKVKPTKPKNNSTSTTKTATSTAKVKKPKATVADVLAEVLRDDGNCDHVANPQPPNFLFGDEATVRAIPLEIEMNIESSHIKKGGRKLREDAHVLLAGISTFPREMMEADPLRYQKWKDANLDYLKKKYGKNLKAVVEHLDEAHPHIHFYVLDSNQVNAKLLHDGHVAAQNEKPMTKAYNTAYSNAMREVQTHYYENVGHPLGLLRDGPKKKREDRDVWKARKTEADLRYRLDQVAEAKRLDIDSKNAQLDQELQNVPLVIESKVSELVAEKTKALESNYQSKEQALEAKATKRTEGIDRLEALVKERSTDLKNEVARQAKEAAKPMASRMANTELLRQYETVLEPIPDAPTGMFSGKKWQEVYDSMKHIIVEQCKKLAVSDRAVDLARETYELRAREDLKAQTKVDELTQQIDILLKADIENGSIYNYMKHWLPAQTKAITAHYHYEKATEIERQKMNIAKHIPVLAAIDKSKADFVVSQYNLNPSSYTDWSAGDFNMDISSSMTNSRKKKAVQE